MRLYLSGDSEAFNSLYRRHASKVFTYLFKRTGGKRDLTEELHQGTFLKFHQSRSLYDSKYPVLQWLYVISRTTLLDHYRKVGRQVPEIIDVPVEEIAETAKDMSQEPDLSALEQLTDEHRQIVEWRYLDEQTYEEIAARLGRSQESIRQVISRALRKIKAIPRPKRSEP